MMKSTNTNLAGIVFRFDTVKLITEEQKNHHLEFCVKQLLEVEGVLKEDESLAREYE